MLLADGGEGVDDGYAAGGLNYIYDDTKKWGIRGIFKVTF